MDEMAPSQELDSRQVKLREYLRELARDMILLGTLRQQMGVNPIQILLQKPAVTMGVILRDLEVAGLSVKNELVEGLKTGLMGAVGRFLQRG